MASGSWEGSARVGSAVGTDADGAGASARRDQRGPLPTVPLKSQPARSGRAPWLQRRVWSMLGSGSPRRGRGRQSPRAPSHARAAALLSRPRGRLEDHTGTQRVSPAKQRLELQELCRPEPDLHPTLGCQREERALGAKAGEGLGCRCQQAHTTPQPCLAAPAWHPSLPFSVVLSVFCNLWRNVDGIRCTSLPWQFTGLKL